MTWRRRLPPEHQDLLAPQEPAWEPPMLATLVEEVPRGAWVYERKLDGYRTVAVCGEEGARLHSRAGKDVTERFPFTHGLPRRPCVLDGEVVAFREGPGGVGGAGRDSFAAVQRGEATNLVLFDVLNLDGFDLRRLPWTARHALLDELDIQPPCARLPNTAGDGEAMRERACEMGWEGLIAKDPDAPYVPGRSRAWRKLKCVQGQEFVVGGFTEPGGTRVGLGSLLVGYHDGDDLRYAGRVGAGFDDETLRRLRPRLEGLEQPRPPFVEVPREVARAAHWVRPELVCQVDFTEWTSDGRLRHPRFLGLRDDKPAVEVTRAG